MTRLPYPRASANSLLEPRGLKTPRTKNDTTSHRGGGGEDSQPYVHGHPPHHRLLLLQLRLLLDTPSLSILRDHEGVIDELGVVCKCARKGQGEGRGLVIVVG